jgi:hypothetical protein
MADRSGYSAQVLQSWSTAYSACFQLYEDDKLEECIDTAESDLSDMSMPLYYRMKYELVLASCLGDWWEAEDALNRCENIWQSTHAYHEHDADAGADADANNRVQECLRNIRELLDGARAEHDVLPHAVKDPRMAEDEDFEYDDDDLRMADDFEEDEENEENEEDEEDEDFEENEDEEARDTTMDLEQIVEETVEEADSSLKSMPSKFGSSMPAATGEVEEPMSSEPSKAEGVKSWARLTPKLSADPPRLPELPFRTTKSAQVSPLPLPTASATPTLVSAAAEASKQGLVSKLVSQIDNREKGGNPTSAADRMFKSPKVTVKKEPEPEPTSPRKKSAAPAYPTIAKREPKTD